MKKRRLPAQQNNGPLPWKNSMRVLLMSLVGTGIYADIPAGIIGGQNSDSSAYAALISSDGSITSVSGLPAASQINAVSINSGGIGLIGGQANSASGYAAYVSPSGGLTPLTLSLPSGTIAAAAINQSGQGLIGGTDSSGIGVGYAAFVAMDGTVTPLSFSDNGNLYSVALNDAGVGLIGGEGGGAPYAAYIASDGTVTPVPNPPAGGGRLYVAINSQGNGILGGYVIGGGAYAGFVTPTGSSPTLLQPIPSNTNSGLNAVAINNSGAALIGGFDGSGNAYAGLSDALGNVTTIFANPFPGEINSVALNDSGIGLIGGGNNSNPYAALMQSDGTILSLIPNSVVNGEINWVAINQAGVGLIGGQQNSIGYAALMAPNGTLTVLDMSNQSIINGVATTPSNIPNLATPQSVGSHSSTFYTQLAFVSSLDSRLGQSSPMGPQDKKSSTEPTSIAHNEHNLAGNGTDLAWNRKLTYDNEGVAHLSSKNSIWIAPFGNYVHLKNQGTSPSYTNEIGGALLAYDHQESHYIVGGALGYAFNYIHYAQSLGHGKLQEELGCLYGSYYQENFRIVGSAWGGFYQVTNDRHTLSFISSKSKTHGWILSPHLEMASPWALNSQKTYWIEPFFTLDWVNSWQKGYTESGAAGFNLKMGSLYGSLLQSEVGLRFYERFVYGWGEFFLKEKLSYVNQAPFHLNSVTTSFVGSASTFPVAVASTKVENLAAVQLVGSFTPDNHAYPFGGFDIQVTANSSYQSYFISLFGGFDF